MVRDGRGHQHLHFDGCRTRKKSHPLPVQMPRAARAAVPAARRSSCRAAVPDLFLCGQTSPWRKGSCRDVCSHAREPRRETSPQAQNAKATPRRRETPPRRVDRTTRGASKNGRRFKRGYNSLPPDAFLFPMRRVGPIRTYPGMALPSTTTAKETHRRVRWSTRRRPLSRRTDPIQPSRLPKENRTTTGKGRWWVWMVVGPHRSPPPPLLLLGMSHRSVGGPPLPARPHVSPRLRCGTVITSAGFFLWGPRYGKERTRRRSTRRTKGKRRTPSPERNATRPCTPPIPRPILLLC